jgi:hypothetical protein
VSSVANLPGQVLSFGRGNAMSDKAGKAAIVTVHGTGDTADKLEGEKWFQRGSPFAERLLGHLRHHGVEADIFPHLWSGANSAWDRERAANELARRIRGLYNKYDSIHVIGHSHGGNVANDAAVLLKWGLRRNAKREKFDSLTTVGTPFFNVRTGPMQIFAGMLFQILAWGSAIAFPLTVLAWLSYAWSAAQRFGGDTEGLLVGALAYAALVAPCVWLMLHMSAQGVRRILRPRTGGATKTTVLSIWHENDEAIAFLQRVEELNLEPFPRGALFRGSRAGAISFGVLAVIAISFAIPVLFVFGIDPLNLRQLAAAESVTGAAQQDIYEFIGVVIAIIVLGLWLAPPLFTGIYLGFRYLFGGAAEIGARGPMNRYVGGVLRGVAMGRDGDQVLCNVAPRSHTHRTQEFVLTGECAERMKEGANGAAGKLIDKYRWALFSVGGDSSASLTSLTTDAMTWDSLIHTTYFDQPEVAAAIADHIARTVRESAHAEAPGPAATSATAPVVAMAAAPAAVMETPGPAAMMETAAPAAAVEATEATAAADAAPKPPPDAEPQPG